MQVLLISIGTDGDILPYVGLGVELLRRGHAATLVASEDYEPLARRHGFGFHPLVTRAENQELFGHPDFWHPRKTPALSARWGVRFLRRQYDLLAGLATRDTVLVANPGVFAAGLLHETTGIPWTNLILQPWLLPSSLAPPLIPGYSLLAHAPPPVWRVFWRALDLVGDRLVGRELNALRATLGLPPARRIFRDWLAPQRLIGLFPDWFGPTPKDWPPPLRLAGFPQFSGAPETTLPPAILQFCQVGPPPVVFTFGTGMAHPGELFRLALDACRQLGVRAIFLTKFPDQLPPELPATIIHSAFVPFPQLFPHCAALVHHGGIGTTANALAAGLPQLIRPICFDQLDNASRVKRLDAGACLPASKTTGRHLATALAPLLTEAARERCRQLARRFAGPDPLAQAADWVEKLGGA